MGSCVSAPRACVGGKRELLKKKRNWRRRKATNSRVPSSQLSNGSADKRELAELRKRTFMNLRFQGDWFCPLSFLACLGDIDSGSRACSLQNLSLMIGLYSSVGLQESLFIYTLGSNGGLVKQINFRQNVVTLAILIECLVNRTVAFNKNKLDILATGNDLNFDWG